MRAFIASILAIYAGLFTMAFVWFAFAIPVMLVFWGLEHLPFGQVFLAFTEGLKNIILMVLLIWVFVRFIAPAFFDTIRVAYGISMGKQPPNPYAARDKVMLRFADLGRDIGRAWGLVHKVRRLF
jgi:hypothetical protein